jgi:hypothetical protein
MRVGPALQIPIQAFPTPTGKAMTELSTFSFPKNTLNISS